MQRNFFRCRSLKRFIEFFLRLLKQASSFFKFVSFNQVTDVHIRLDLNLSAEVGKPFVAHSFAEHCVVYADFLLDILLLAQTQIIESER